MPSATFGACTAPASAGRLKLRPLVPHAADLAAARAAATPDQLANQMADVIVAATDARGRATVDDIRRAGFTDRQVAEICPAAIEIVHAREAAAGREREDEA